METEIVFQKKHVGKDKNNPLPGAKAEKGQVKRVV